jgi:hypothetical protein
MSTSEQQLRPRLPVCIRRSTAQSGNGAAQTLLGTCNRLQWYQRQLLNVQIRTIGRRIRMSEQSEARVSFCIREHPNSHNVSRPCNNSKRQQSETNRSDDCSGPANLTVTCKDFHVDSILTVESTSSSTCGDFCRGDGENNGRDEENQKILQCTSKRFCKRSRKISRPLKNPKRQQYKRNRCDDCSCSTKLPFVSKDLQVVDSILGINSPSSSTCGDFCVEGEENNGRDKENQKTFSFISKLFGKRSVSTFTSTVSTRQCLDESSSACRIASDGSTTLGSLGSATAEGTNRKKRGSWLCRRLTRKNEWFRNPSPSQVGGTVCTIMMDFYYAEEQQFCKYKLVYLI